MTSPLINLPAAVCGFIQQAADKVLTRQQQTLIAVACVAFTCLRLAYSTSCSLKARFAKQAPLSMPTTLSDLLATMNSLASRVTQESVNAQSQSPARKRNDVEVSASQQPNSPKICLIEKGSHVVVTTGDAFDGDNGNGTVVLSNGDSLIGSFKNGLLHSADEGDVCVACLHGGIIQRGYFQEGKLVKGEQITRSLIQSGPFVEGKLNGQGWAGILRDGTLGCSQGGEFVDGVPSTNTKAATAAQS